jgi:hypothetical protein
MNYVVAFLGSRLIDLFAAVMAAWFKFPNWKRFHKQSLMAGRKPTDAASAFLSKELWQTTSE